jgi:sugar lactone lactonase YvrE
MYWSDTHQQVVWAHDYDAESGTPGVPRPFADFTVLPGAPDGACVDETSAVWVAGVGGGSLLRFTPKGALDRMLELPLRSPTMPAFGGPGLDTLYVTSIGRAASASAPLDGPIDGALLAIDVGVTGVAEPPFGARQEAGSERTGSQP